jgi:tetratricopeptide (TPR) repeat protein
MQTDESISPTAPQQVEDWATYVRDFRLSLNMGRDRFARVLNLQSARSVLRWEMGDRDPKTGQRVLQRPSPQLQERLMKIKAELKPAQIPPTSGLDSREGNTFSSRLDQIVVALRADTPDRKILREALELIQEAIRRREASGPVDKRNVDRTKPAPDWLKFLLELLDEKEWLTAARVAPHFSALAETLDADGQCLYLLRWGIAAGRSGDPKTQALLCDLGIDIAKNDGSVPAIRLRGLLVGRGCALVRMGEYKSAKQAFEEALGLDRDDPQAALYNLLTVSSLMHDLAGCENYSDILVKKFNNADDPDDPLGHAIATDADLEWWRAQDSFTRFFTHLLTPIQ